MNTLTRSLKKEVSNAMSKRVKKLEQQIIQRQYGYTSAMVKTKFTLDEIHQYDSFSNRILLSIMGIVYDVTTGKDFFGYGGPYDVYAGCDCTYALATMDLTNSAVDKFEYELDEKFGDSQTLADWVAYFDFKYIRVGELVDRTHPIDITTLPKGKNPKHFASQDHPVVNDTPEAIQEFKDQLTYQKSKL